MPCSIRDLKGDPNLENYFKPHREVQGCRLDQGLLQGGLDKCPTDHLTLWESCYTTDTIQAY